VAKPVALIAYTALSEPLTRRVPSSEIRHPLVLTPEATGELRSIELEFLRARMEPARMSDPPWRN